MRIAMFQQPLGENRVLCRLCPRACRIDDGSCGFCRVRINRSGTLFTVADFPAAIQVDPIEKKPLARYRPGSRVLSIGTFGCNLTCRFCQNYHLSRHVEEEADETLAPEMVPTLAQRYGCESVALTYNEPTVFIEYALELLRAARAAGLGTVLVSNGFISPEARAELYPLVDAANIDVKGFSQEFYRRLCAGELRPVLGSCESFKHRCGGHLEITNLLIPGENDSAEMIDALLDWAAEHLGLDTPLHFSACCPAGSWTAPPTPPGTVRAAAARARERGFEAVFCGNI